MDSSLSLSPSNPDLAKEARSTQDCDRQQELAVHPSALVLWNLAQNLMLCEAALKIIGENEVHRLKSLTEDQVLKLLK